MSRVSLVLPSQYCWLTSQDLVKGAGDGRMITCCQKTLDATPDLIPNSERMTRFSSLTWSSLAPRLIGRRFFDKTLVFIIDGWFGGCFLGRVIPRFAGRELSISHGSAHNIDQEQGILLRTAQKTKKVRSTFAHQISPFFSLHAWYAEQAGIAVH